MGDQFQRIGWMALLLALAVSTPLPAPAQSAPDPRPAVLEIIELKSTDGEILSYRHGTSSTEVFMRGTGRARMARIKLKVGSRPGFTELDINRGDIKDLQPAFRYGRDFLTYVLWAVSVDGEALNLGEITFDRGSPVSINVTTPYQTFWLMVTAEPDYAVADPSPMVVLYSVKQEVVKGKPETKAMPLEGDMFYYTHYSEYSTDPSQVPDGVPNELLQARKAVELASKSGILAITRGRGARISIEEQRTRRTLEQARQFLTQAEAAYREKPGDQAVVQFGRTSAQIAENARALAVGAVGGAMIRQLEQRVTQLESRLTESNDRLTIARRELSRVKTELGEPVGDPPEGDLPSESTPQPAIWFGVIGWVFALLLLLRRQPN